MRLFVDTLKMIPVPEENTSVALGSPIIAPGPANSPITAIIGEIAGPGLTARS